jgi:hypothetical protein
LLFSLLLVLGILPATMAHATTVLAPDPVYMTQAGSSGVLYVLWARTCSRNINCFELERSMDGGQTFTALTPPPIHFVRNATIGNLEDLVFANSLDGYAVKRTNGVVTLLYATFDGARTWHQEVIAPAQAINTIIASSTAFYAMASFCPTSGASSCHQVRLERSAIGSGRWTNQSTVTLGFSHNEGEPSLAAFGPDVWLTLQEQNKPYHSLLATSYNEGRTFAVRTQPLLTSVSACQLSATSTITLWAQCDDGMMAGNIVYSSDGGAHWSVNQGESGAFMFGYFDPVTSFYAIYFDGNHLRRLERLTAATHTAVLVGRTPIQQQFQLAFVNEHQGVALSYQFGNLNRQALYETSDAGQRWRRITLHQ